ncbi:hypothetical protein GCM10009122_60900 [Fulvivirga kasyanovii]|uniref:DUF304 domain-containing protein n=1 Tax=Fulvivirga kasyanovii TaxID=396812 RepID=A0ABW9RTD4_9BACT|nr:hypothetical protein [Fulvivirga kasyanovii]MTI26966.1 hypothetical protein [Fulvivirga kasyanovii]
MKFKSEYYYYGFSDQVIYRRLISAFALFAGTFSIVAIFHFDGSETNSRGTFTKILYGLGNMSLDTYAIVLPIAIFSTITVLLILNAKYKHRNIVVGLDLNEKDKVLRVRTRALSGAVADTELPYSKVKIIHERLSDGWTGPMYDCLTILNSDTMIGHFYKDHDMWTSGNSDKLEKLLKGIRYR